MAQSKPAELDGKHENFVFLSILMDGSTDSTIIDEFFLVTWCNNGDQGQIVCTSMSYLCVARPKKVDGQGLFYCLAQHVFSSLEYKILVLSIVNIW